MPRDSYYFPSRRLVSQDEAAIIERATVPRSKFTGSWTRKTAFDAGYLVPFLIEEVLPGDHLSYNVTAYARMATPLFPILDNLRLDTFFFYTPCRLVWDNWVKFMGEQIDPDDSIDFTIPQIISNVSGFAVGSIYDHFGLPTEGQITGGQSITINALPLRMYNLIWNTWFRDQNIQNSLSVHKGDATDPAADYTLKKRAKAHDYFTSALPWPQKFTAPSVPLVGNAPVSGIGLQAVTGTINPADVTVRESVDMAGSVQYSNAIDPNTYGNLYVRAAVDGLGNRPDVYADLSSVSGVAINTFRQAFLVQQLLERDARGGTRYVELIWSHFGIKNPDFRVQRPEYIGGGQTPLQITPVAQTAPSEEMPVGALGAAGTAVGQHRASYAATEHGYIIGLINVRSELSYQQGVHRMWHRLTRYDFYWPTLSGLGEQAVLRQEIYANGVNAEDPLVFGYQERWHEYRTRYSEVTGLMRSTATGTLDNWHLAQRFVGAPTLSTGFIEDAPPMTRILAAGELAANQQFIADIMIERNAVRPIPTFGTPVTLGRF